MSLRDLDLLVGAIVMAVATVLARLADPALAIIVLSLVVSSVIAWLGEDRLEALWRAYSAPLPAKVPAPRIEKPIKMYRRPVGPVRAEPLARARLLTRRR
jgi:hypothetical protein